MNFYRIVFDGVYLSGVAVVAAETEQEALQLAADAVHTTAPRLTLENASVTMVPVPGPCVIYVDDGDY